MKKGTKEVSKRELALAYIVLVGVIAAYTLLGFGPLNAKVAAKKTEVTLLNEKIETSNKQINEIMAQNAAPQPPPTEQGSSLTEYVSSSRRMAQIFQHLIVADDRLTTRLIRVDDVLPPADPKTRKPASLPTDHKDVAFKIELIGAFPAIGAFVERVEAAHILAKVSAVEVERVPNDLEKCVARITVNARLFSEDEND